ncbi:death domain-containing protein CRADD-like [Branchiostoma lanceolatum]|uniref:death domain-containing protein CRADD-like n=1 Tax=Branchiostoma lanceolatum TaxID=7740 RepID=UPI003452BE1A
MEERHRKILKRKYKELTRDLRPDDVMDHLIQEDILDFNDLELVRAQPGTKMQVEKLLSILVSRGSSAFRVFLESLEDPYPWLYDDLKKEEECFRKQRSPGNDVYITPNDARYPLQETRSSLQQTSDPEEDDTRTVQTMHLTRCTEHMFVPPEVANKRVTEKQLNVLAGKLGLEWEDLAIHLDMKMAEVDRFKAENPFSMRSRAFSMLISWKARQGTNATVRELVDKLEDYGIEQEKLDLL